ncbi:MAG: hypothetical protein NTV56_25065 [Alphaproteobacteria bacterium]|nr:hypothetical protein [Alphaproteobacteria bacterium]
MTDLIESDGGPRARLFTLGVGHVSADHMHVAPLSPRVSRRVALVQLRGKRTTEGV